MSLHTTGIDHLNIAVKNLEESCAFYKKLLGFTTLEDIPEQNGRIIGNKQAKLALYQVPEVEYNGSTGFAHAGFHISNFDEVEVSCKRLGIPISFGGLVDWPHSRSAYITDPNGYEIELSEVWGGGLD